MECCNSGSGSWPFRMGSMGTYFQGRERSSADLEGQMNLIDVNEQFKNDEQCLAYLEQMRWPNGVRCVTCGNDKISRVTRESKSKNKRTTFYQCLEPTCKQQFTPTAGTIMHDSHLPLHKWFMAL